MENVGNLSQKLTTASVSTEEKIQFLFAKFKYFNDALFSGLEHLKYVRVKCF